MTKPMTCFAYTGELKFYKNLSSFRTGGLEVYMFTGGCLMFTGGLRSIRT